ncbi:MAG: hypothetical protein FWE08_01385 [Oscillospiraceae bacterium]|nr:hypothetical protein [Oscillospiraceae bacterium]
MRRLAALLFALMLLLSATACSGEQDPNERILELRERFLASDQRFAAELTADYGDRVHRFTLRFDSAASTLEVLAPELIAGIVIEVSESGTVLHFEGAELNTGPLTEDGLSPLAALPMIVFQWKEGIITAAHYETFHDIRCVVMTTAISDNVQHMTWFDAETGVPIKAEILEDGFAVLTVAFEGGPLFGLG